MASKTKNQDEKIKHLERMYYDPSSGIAYSNPNRVYKFLKSEGKFNYSLNEIKSWLETQDSYTTHSQKRRNKKYRRVFSNKGGYIYDVDIAYYKTANNQKFSKFLLATDVFTRVTHAIPVRNLKGETIIEAFKKLFEVMPPPQLVRSDSGSEFIQKKLKNYLKSKKIHIFTATVPHKANHAEIKIKNLKALLTKITEKKAIKNWVDALPEALMILNNSVNRSLGLSPNEAAKIRNRHRVSRKLKIDHLKRLGPPLERYSFDLDDTIRVKVDKGAFGKSHEPSFSEQTYKIISREVKDNVDYYRIKNSENEPIKGKFTAGELMKVNVSDDTLYRIEKVYKTIKNIDGKIYRLVKWFGYKDKTYVLDSDIQSVNES